MWITSCFIREVVHMFHVVKTCQKLAKTPKLIFRKKLQIVIVTVGESEWNEYPGNDTTRKQQTFLLLSHSKHIEHEPFSSFSSFIHIKLQSHALYVLFCHRHHHVGEWDKESSENLGENKIENNILFITKICKLALCENEDKLPTGWTMKNNNIPIWCVGKKLPIAIATAVAGDIKLILQESNTNNGKCSRK